MVCSVQPFCVFMSKKINCGLNKQKMEKKTYKDKFYGKVLILKDDSLDVDLDRNFHAKIFE